MKIAIIGAGFTGLSAAYQLAKDGHTVTILEKDERPGGLAIGFKEKHWEWTFEKHYHHWFTNKNDAVNHDQSVLNLAKEIGHKVIIKRPKTSVYVNGHIYQFDGPKEVLTFPELSLLERLRMAAIVGLIRYNPFWRPLEKINAATFLPKVMGEKAYKMLWEPQLMNKFGELASDVSLAWLWARIVSRTPSLAYPEGGYLSFATHLVTKIEEKKGKVHFNAEVVEITDNGQVFVTWRNTNGTKKKETFEKLIFTGPSFLFLKTFPQFTDSYKKTFHRLKSLGATNLVLRLKKPFLPNNTYWLSICDKQSPIMVIVDHTNFMDKKHYHNEHLVYLGNYMMNDDPRYAMNKAQRLQMVDPFLRKINPDYKKYLIGTELFKAPFAQPVIPTNYSSMIPSMTTPLPNVYLANIDQVYPWDRGTSNAVYLGKKVANLVMQKET